MRHNILITGGFGLLGKPLTLKLINLKHNVFILEKKNTKRLKCFSKRRYKFPLSNRETAQAQTEALSLPKYLSLRLIIMPCRHRIVA